MLIFYLAANRLATHLVVYFLHINALQIAIVSIIAYIFWRLPRIFISTHPAASRFVEMMVMTTESLISHPNQLPVTMNIMSLEAAHEIVQYLKTNLPLLKRFRLKYINIMSYDSVSSPRSLHVDSVSELHYKVFIPLYRSNCDLAVMEGPYVFFTFNFLLRLFIPLIFFFRKYILQSNDPVDSPDLRNFHVPFILCKKLFSRPTHFFITRQDSIHGDMPCLYSQRFFREVLVLNLYPRS